MKLPLRILMADDASQFHRIYRTAIAEAADEPAEIEFADTGDRALARLQGEETYDLCILDYYMPGKTGEDVLRALRADSKFDTLPIVILTGASDPELQETLLEAGADDFIVKGGPPEIFIARIRNQLRYRQDLDRLVRRTIDIDIFAAGVVHDLRNLEMAIFSIVELAFMQLADGKTDDIAEDLQTLRERLQQISTYAREMIQFAREPLTKSTPETLRLQPIIDWAADLARGHEKNRTLKISSENNLGTVRGDPYLVKLVFLNIFQNAIKYSGSEEAHIEIIAQPGNPDQTLIAVRDHGLGVPQEDLRKIFQPFYRCATKRQRPGVGLGLALVNKAIADMEGRIWADQPGTGPGTIFFVSLPKGSS